MKRTSWVYVLLTVAFCASLSNLTAQTGNIKGNVLDLTTGDVLPFASIKTLGPSDQFTQTDFDGNFSFNDIPVGTYKLVFQFVGFKSDTLHDVEVKPGELTVIEHGMTDDALLTGVVTISVKKDNTGNIALAKQQQESEVMEENIGAEELSKQGVSNVETAVTKVSGISKGSKRVFVRGLDDRYNLALINGMIIPSGNPDQKVIPLDIIPTDVVQSINVSKAYSAERYADYAGALINVKTVDYPEKPYLKIGIGSSYNTVATGKDFRLNQLGSVPFFGIDGGNRDVPNEIMDSKNDNYKEDSKNPYSTPYGTGQTTALPNLDFKLSGGKFFSFDSVGSNRGIGASLSITSGNEYKRKDEGVTALYNTSNATIFDYDFTENTFSTNTSVLGRLFYKINPNNNISYNFMFVKSTDEIFVEVDGRQQDNGELYFSRGTFFDITLLSHQLFGNHEFDTAKLDFSWGVTYSTATSEEKDRRDALLRGDEVYSLSLLNNPGDYSRFFSRADDQELIGKIEASYYLNSREADHPNKVTVGANMRYKEQDFDYSRVFYRFPDLDAPILDEQISDVYALDEYFSEENLQDGEFDFTEERAVDSKYYANLIIPACYAKVDYMVTPKLQTIVGLRVEQGYESIEYKTRADIYSADPRVNEIDSLDFFPSLNLRYILNDSANLRFAASRTITRPGFREIAPFLYQAYFGGPNRVGNPNLTNAYNYNVDLKYELFPKPGQLMSFTLFGKYLQNPIETTILGGSERTITFRNNQAAYVGGIELEFNRNIGDLFKQDSTFFNRFDVGCNVSLLYSQIQLDTTQALVNTNTERQLQGASPYLVNFDLSYRIEKENFNSTITAVYNVFGRRIYSVGVNGIGDIYELPVNTLDLVIRNTINERFSANLSFKNILNPKIERVVDQPEEIGGQELLTNSFRKGMRVGLSFGYTF